MDGDAFKFLLLRGCAICLSTTNATENMKMQ